MRRSSVVVSAVLALTACGKKKDPPAAGSGSSVTVVTPVDAAVAIADAVAAKPAPITKAVRAEYKRRLAAGRKAAKATKWSDAITELEAALAAIPGDDRALAELSFAAMSAGDHDKARAAGRQAVRTATDPKVKAAALYNLGRVEENGAPAKAAALYRESLALRPNATVEQRLAALAKAGTGPSQPYACATPATLDAICACLNKTTDVAPEVQRCDTSDTGLPDFQLATYLIADVGEEQMALLGKSDGGWSVVANLDSVYNPGMFGISEEWKLDSAKDERFGTHSIARFVSKKERSDADMGIDEAEFEETTTLVVCVRDNVGGPPICPIDVETNYTYLRERTSDTSDDEMGIDPGDHTPGLPLRNERKVSVEIGADGVAKVRQVVGRAYAPELGDKRLW